MTYYHKVTFAGTPAEAEKILREALKEEGFGVLTEIDVQATLKNKIGAEIAPYKILGACNPPYAHRALTAEPWIGLMLPCNVVVRTGDGGVTEAAAVDPVASMAAVDNPGLADVAGEIREKLRRALDRAAGT